MTFLAIEIENQDQDRVKTNRDPQAYKIDKYLFGYLRNIKLLTIDGLLLWPFAEMANL